MEGKVVIVMNEFLPECIGVVKKEKTSISLVEVKAVRMNGTYISPDLLDSVMDVKTVIVKKNQLHVVC